MPNSDVSAARLTKLAFGCFVIGVILRFLPVLLPDHFDTLFDDSYYALSIARNIADGKGVTCAGNPTNGFQPLLVFSIVPFYMLFNDFVAESCVLAMLALASAATCLLIRRVLQHMGCRSGAEIGLIIWSLSPYAIRHGVNGLETALTSFFLFWSLDYYLRQIRGKKRSGGRGFHFPGYL